MPTEIQDLSKARWENPNSLHVFNQLISKRGQQRLESRDTRQQETDSTALKKSEFVECNARWAVRKFEQF